MEHDRSLLEQVIGTEWEMFRTVNGDQYVDCQEDPQTFAGMRAAQFRAWPADALRSYADDLARAKREGRNLLREKYIRMMRSTEPENYEILRRELPEDTPEKLALTEEIWQLLLPQTRALREKYPTVMQGARPLLIAEENGWSSVEGYQKSELMTYSAETLWALLHHIRALTLEGRSFAAEVEENTVGFYGFQSLQEAEEKLSARAGERA